MIRTSRNGATKRAVQGAVLGAFLLYFSTMFSYGSDPSTVRFVYLTGSGCRACSLPKYKERIASIRTTAQHWAKAHHYPFKTTGVTTDEDKAVGDRFLSETGTYDETISGKGFDAILPYIEPYEVQSPLAMRGIPQVVILLESSQSTRPRELYRATGNLIVSEYTESAKVKATLDKAIRKR